MKRPTSARPSYQSKAVRLGDQLAADLAAGRFTGCDRLPTDEALARMYRAARVTVRRAITLLEARALVQRVPRQGVRPLAASAAPAPAVPAPRRSAIAVLIAARPDESLVRMRDGVRRYTDEHGLTLLLVDGDAEDPDRPLAALERLPGRGVDGAVVLPYPGAAETGLLEHLHANGFPLVCVERRTADLALPSVEPDAAGGTYQATMHLIERHGRAPWFLGLTTAHHVDACRFEGWRCALRDAGFADEAERQAVRAPVPTDDPAWWRQDEKWRPGHAAARLLLERIVLPASVVCDKDYIAWGLYRLAQERGLSIGPRSDLAVTGFDDLAIARRLSPPLTTMAQDLALKGYEAARLLHRLVQGDRGGPRTVTLPVQLVVRGSS